MLLVKKSKSRCDEFLATMPSNFFKSENIKKDSPDFSVMKMIFYTFSKDFKKIEELLAGVYLVKEEWIFLSSLAIHLSIYPKKMFVGKECYSKKLITCKYTRMEDKGRFKRV